MSSEELTTSSYSDAQSSIDNHDTSIPSSSNDGPSGRRAKQRATTSIFLRSESLFLALLFAFVAILLPTFFFFASPSSPKTVSSEDIEDRKSPLTALLPYVPAISTVFHSTFALFHLFLRPVFAAISLTLVILAPMFLVFNILLQFLVILPSKLVAELARFLYPIYVFCGAAVLFGIGIGLGSRLLLEGSKVITPSYDHAKEKDRKRLV
ncbi:hypothetical protein K439DRAFT_1630940 [Ramaria rubella]|nr:hypothetical protein K439DRAFT_1630940 [Ramaria rubella]